MGDATFCLSIPGLTRSQLKLCYQQPDAISVVLEGLHVAANECQYQFQGHRWNCSSLATNVRNPFTSTILKRGMFYFWFFCKFCWLDSVTGTDNTVE